MNIQEIINERKKWFEWKNIKPLRTALEKLPQCDTKIFNENGIIKIKFNNFEQFQNIKEEIFNTAKLMMPWRKGPFEIEDIFIDSEWQSQKKYSILQPHLKNLENKTIADIGCNNGYYMFRLFLDGGKNIVGFDPSPLFKTQFDFINHFAKTEIQFEMLGVEHLPLWKNRFDIILALGILYHRENPIATLKYLKQGLNPNGTLFLDTFFIEHADEVALFPENRYAKMRNIYFIPTIKTLENWAKRAKFTKFEIIAKIKTTTDEQRKTDWIEGESLNNFLDPDNPNLTIEGYPAPQRVYVKLS